MEDELITPLKKLGIPIEIIDENRNYWLIRTDSGEYYDEFYHDKFVGMGWDELNKFDKDEHYNDEFMTAQVNKFFPKVKQEWRVYTQIRKFIYEINIGDIVLIPSKSHISFGKIISDVYYEENVQELDLLEGLCPFEKRREVEWLKTIKRDELDPYLYKLLNSHFTISNAFDYAPYIDRTLHGLYFKNDQAHLVLRVRKEGKVYLKEINRLTDGALNVIDMFNQLTDSDLNSNEIESKMNVQSPGPIELIAGGLAVIVLGLILHYTIGGKFSGKATLSSVEVEGETEGLLEKLLKFRKNTEKDKKSKDKLDGIKAILDEMEVELPEELTNLKIEE